MISINLDKLVVIVYKGYLKDFYRIEIVNTKTNEVLDYIDKRKKYKK